MLVEGSVGAVGVVVVEVVDDESVELALVPDEGAVDELAAQGADPAFGEGVGHWCAHVWGSEIPSWLVMRRFGIR